MNQPHMRLATKEDLPALIDLWAYCFNDGDIFQNWYFKNYYREEECIVVTEKDAIVASLQVIDLPTVVGNETLQAGYIVGVDCLPEHRGQGFTRMLMETVIEEFAPRKGYAFLHLMPFEANFYEPFGFVFGDYHAKMTLPIEEFYRSAYREAAKSFHWKTVDLDCYSESLSLLETIYNRAMSAFDGYVVRDSARRWSALLDDARLENGHCKIIYNKNGDAEGYIVYIFVDGRLLVRELQAVTQKARQAMYYFIASHRSQVKEVQWSAPLHEPIVYVRKKDKLGVAIEPFMMQLIIDPCCIAAFASRLPDENVDFCVEDDKYRWYAHSQKIERIENVVETAPRFTRATLSQLVLGSVGWEVCEADACYMKMRALFTEKKQFFNNEYF